MFIIPNTNCLLSSKLFTSSANDDIVVKEPQKPIAKKKAYFGQDSMKQLKLKIFLK